MPSESGIKKVLRDSRINLSGVAGNLKDKNGLSRQSITNKLRDGHYMNFSDENIRDIKKELEILAKFILKNIH